MMQLGRLRSKSGTVYLRFQRMAKRDGYRWLESWKF